MKKNTKNSNVWRITKLIIYALVVLVGYILVITNLKKPGFGSGDIVGWLMVYIPCAILAGDVLDTVQGETRIPWALAMFCMPMFAIPCYIVMYGKQDAL